MTNNFVTKAYTPTEEDLEKIKSFTQRDFAPDELFIFKMVLCTNEADRDFDVFSPAALRDMQKLFIGKPGLRDHINGTDYQTARIFDTYLEPASGKGFGGDELLCLKAKAYIPRCNETAALINAVESGIKREVSVSCAIGKSHCSICGETEGCSHIPGKKYKGRLCARVIDSVTDAYEWSFVAVPAQRYAGVTKAFTKGGDDYSENNIDNECGPSSKSSENTETTAVTGRAEPASDAPRVTGATNEAGANRAKGTEHTQLNKTKQETLDAAALKQRLNAGTGVTLSAAEAGSLANVMAENEKLQKLAAAYTAVLRKYALRLAKAVPGADVESLESLLKGLNAPQLQQFTAALQGCEPGSEPGNRKSFNQYSECREPNNSAAFSAFSEQKQFNGNGKMPAPQLSPLRAESLETKNLNEFKI